MHMQIHITNKSEKNETIFLKKTVYINPTANIRDERTG